MLCAVAFFSSIALGIKSSPPPASLKAIANDTHGSNGAIHEVLLSEPLNTEPGNVAHRANPRSIRFEAMGRIFNLTLTPSRFNHYIHLVDQPPSRMPVYYEGKIDDDPNSWVRVAIDDDTPAGYLFYFGELFRLDTRASISGHDTTTHDDLVLVQTLGHPDAASLLGGLSPQVDNIQYAPLYALSDEPLFSPQRSPLKSSPKPDTLEPATNDAQVRAATDTVVTRAMRVGIVVDSRFNDYHNGRGLARALSIMNSVDAIYQSQLGIAIVIEGIRVYDDPATDPMYDRGGNVDTILANFRSIRMSDSRLPNDLTLVHLFSGHRDPESVIGLGWISTACRLDGYDISMSTPFPFDTLLAAHEIAHNLGALHDDDAQCLVNQDENRTTLMWPKLSGSSTSEFSICSTRNMQAAKNASCNLENIDLSVQLRTLRSNESMQRSVIIEVANKDTYRRGTEAITVTRFPNDTKLTDLSAGCRLQDTTVHCNHGLIPAQTVSRLSLSASLTSVDRQTVISEVTLLNAADIYGLDNRAVIEVLDVDQSSAESLSATPFDQYADFANDNDTISGVGRVSLLDLLLVTVFAVAGFVRTTRRFTCIP